jgi:hypothetical protein
MEVMQSAPSLVSLKEKIANAYFHRKELLFKFNFRIHPTAF